MQQNSDFPHDFTTEEDHKPFKVCIPGTRFMLGTTPVRHMDSTPSCRAILPTSVQTVMMGYDGNGLWKINEHHRTKSVVTIVLQLIQRYLEFIDVDCGVCRYAHDIYLMTQTLSAFVLMTPSEVGTASKIFLYPRPSDHSQRVQKTPILTQENGD